MPLQIFGDLANTMLKSPTPHSHHHELKLDRIANTYLSSAALSGLVAETGSTLVI